MAIIVPLAAMLIQMAVSRSRKYLADESGARICGSTLSLAKALRKLHTASQTSNSEKRRTEAMHNSKKQSRNEPRESEPRKPKALLENVISLRISDQEKRMLEKFTSKTSKSITDIMREALNLWSSKRRSLCMD